VKLSAFYHCYADGEWVEPMTEFLDALEGFDGSLHLGVVGEEVGVPITLALAHFSVVEVLAEDSGFEDVTLNMVRAYALENDGAVLYAHTKGAAKPGECNEGWRRAMTDAVVRPWATHLARLEKGGVDVISCCWVCGWPADDSNFPAGNFWMATCDWLRQLPPVGSEHRYQAEEWVGNRGGPSPRVIDMLPVIAPGVSADMPSVFFDA
jgi:hypothetical protein